MLVTGLLLIGLVADDDGIFEAAGRRLARLPGGGGTLFVGAAILVGIVTAVMNLDTSVAFLTPVLVYTARGRGGGDAALLYGCLLLSNAGSLLLPGSNLTNLIVLGQLNLTGGEFLARMWLPATAALAVTAVAVAAAERRSLRAAPPPAAPGGTGRPAGSGSPAGPGTGPDGKRAAAGPGGAVAGPEGARAVTGLAAVGLAAAAVLALRSPAIPVAVIGVLAAGIHLARRRTTPGTVAAVLGFPVLAGLFGVAVALGALGRAWAGPATLLAHLGGWATAGVGAVASVFLNNLPAASLLAARAPAHPFSLIVGLNLGPNLCVTGSLAWLLWLRAARSAGARPSPWRASAIGLVAVPLSMAAALAALALTGLG